MISPEDLVRKFSMVYSHVSREIIQKELDYYFRLNLEFNAGNDTHTYAPLIGTDFESAE